MKNRTPLMLTELLIMLLVFALAAGLCLRAFLWADSTSARSAALDRALTAAQNGAELTRHYAGDLDTAAREWGGAFDGAVWTFTSNDCQVTVTLLPSQTPYLGTAQVRSGDVELPVSWQKEGP